MKATKRIIGIITVLALCLTSVLSFASCGKNDYFTSDHIAGEWINTFDKTLFLKAFLCDGDDANFEAFDFSGLPEVKYVINFNSETLLYQAYYLYSDDLVTELENAYRAGLVKLYKTNMPETASWSAEEIYANFEEYNDGKTISDMITETISQLNGGNQGMYEIKSGKLTIGKTEYILEFAANGESFTLEPAVKADDVTSLFVCPMEFTRTK